MLVGRVVHALRGGKRTDCRLLMIVHGDTVSTVRGRLGR
jgi:hypothetical protein